MTQSEVEKNVTEGNYTHMWVDVRVGSHVIEMSRWPLMTNGFFPNVTGKEACRIARKLGARLPTQYELDAHHEQAGIKLNPVPQAVLPVVTATCRDLTKVVLTHLPARWQEKTISGIGKHWCRHRNLFPLYGWWLPEDRKLNPPWNGLKYDVATDKTTTSKVIQPYWTKAHNGHHTDYSMTLMLVKDKRNIPNFNSQGEATLYFAKEDLTAGIKETKPNAGSAIATYAEMYDLKPPLNWCAVAVGCWMRRGAYHHGCASAVDGSPGAQATMAQFMKAGLWVDKANLHITDGALTPGNIIVWRRPPKTWTGHIGVIESVHGDVLHTIEGNSGPMGDRVFHNKMRTTSDPKLLGVGRLDTTAVRYLPTEEELQWAAHLMKTSDAVWTCEYDPLDIIA